MDTAFKEAIGASGVVRHLVPRIEVEITDLEPSVEAEDVEEAIKGFFEQEHVPGTMRCAAFRAAAPKKRT